MNEQNDNQDKNLIIVYDLPVNIDANSTPSSAVDEDFLRQLFEGYNVSTSPDSVLIKTKINRNGKPYSFALMKFDTHEDAIKAIQDLNYTKLNGVPIRLILTDKEAYKIN